MAASGKLSMIYGRGVVKALGNGYEVVGELQNAAYYSDEKFGFDIFKGTGKPLRQHSKETGMDLWNNWVSLNTADVSSSPLDLGNRLKKALSQGHLITDPVADNRVYAKGFTGNSYFFEGTSEEQVVLKLHISKERVVENYGEGFGLDGRASPMKTFIILPETNKEVSFEFDNQRDTHSRDPVDVFRTASTGNRKSTPAKTDNSESVDAENTHKSPTDGAYGYPSLEYFLNLGSKVKAWFGNPFYNFATSNTNRWVQPQKIKELNINPIDSSYIIEKGDTVWGIANSCGTSVEAMLLLPGNEKYLKRMRLSEDGEVEHVLIHPGEKIILPKKGSKLYAGNLKAKLK
jgi:hypothetical protein